jgi:hypothetical protein
MFAWYLFVLSAGLVQIEMIFGSMAASRLMDIKFSGYFFRAIISLASP